MIGRRWWAIAAVLALAVVLGACGGGGKDKEAKDEAPAGGQAPGTQPAAKVRRGGTLITTLSNNPKPFDPKAFTDVATGRVASNVFDTLVKLDENLVPQPFLAERIEQPDNVTYIFQLHKGIKFHDGTEMDAEAVKFSIDRIREYPQSVDYSEANYIVESTVVDKYTYKAVLKEPYAPFLNFMTGRTGYVISPTAVKSMGDDGFANKPVGTGPFRFVEWKNDNYVRLRKFENYWRMGADGQPLPYLDAVEFRVMSEPSTRLTALQSGDVHIVDISSQDIEVVRKDPNLVVGQEVGPNFDGLLLNVRKPPFDNKALRQAVAYAIDREEILRAVYSGNAEVANGPMPPPHAFFRDPTFRLYTYNPQKAKEKLAEGGRPNGFEFELYTRSEDSLSRQWAELVQAQLARVGIRMNVQFGDFNGIVIPKLRNGETNASRITFICGYGDPDVCVSRRFLTGSGFNYMGYSNPKVDELILAGRRTTDREERARIYKQVVPMIVEDAPLIFATHEMDTFTGSKKVQNWSIRPRLRSGYADYWLSE